MPVELATLAAFVLAALALVLSPGPDTMLILRYTMAGGHRVGLATVAGVQTGLIGHTIAAVLGLSLVIASSPLLFKGIALAGAAYLAWLALQCVRAGILDLSGLGRASAISGAKAWRDAMLTNLLNPKVILLYIALMPNFVEVGHGDEPQQLAFLGAVLIAVNIAYQVPLSLAAEAARRWLASATVQHAVNWGTGAVLLVFAALMLFEHLF